MATRLSSELFNTVGVSRRYYFNILIEPLLTLLYFFLNRQSLIRYSHTGRVLCHGLLNIEQIK